MPACVASNCSYAGNSRRGIQHPDLNGHEALRTFDMPASKTETRSKPASSASQPPAGSRWFDIVQQLWGSQQQTLRDEPAPKGPHSELSVCSTVRAAIKAAEADPEWSESGVVGHLQNALDIAQNGDCRGCTEAALGLTDFVSIAARKTQQPSASASGQNIGADRSIDSRCLIVVLG